MLVIDIKTSKFLYFLKDNLFRICTLNWSFNANDVMFCVYEIPKSYNVFPSPKLKKRESADFMSS